MRSLQDWGGRSLQDWGGVPNRIKEATMKTTLKKFLIITILISITKIIFAQNPDASTLFNISWINNVNNYASLETKFSQVDDGLGVFIGAKAGVLVNHHYAFCLAGYFMIPQTTDLKYPYFHPWWGYNYYIYNYRLTAGYGGLLFEYILNPDNLINVSASSLVGFGASRISHYYDYYYNHNFYRYYFPTRTFFVVEPSVTANINLTSNFKATLGVSYRQTSNSKFYFNKKEFSNSSIFNGVSLNIGLVFYELF